MCVCVGEQPGVVVGGSISTQNIRRRAARVVLVPGLSPAAERVQLQRPKRSPGTWSRSRRAAGASRLHGRNPGR